MTLYDLVAHDRESVDENMERIVDEANSFVGERKYCRKDGSLVDVEVNAGTVPYGDRRAIASSPTTSPSASVPRRPCARA